jgi:hypothetical protein
MCIEPTLPTKRRGFRKKQYDENANDKKIQSHWGVDITTTSLKKLISTNFKIILSRKDLLDVNVDDIFS